MILRLSLICLLSVFMGWLIWVSPYPFLAFAPLALILYLVYSLIHDLNSTNRLLSHFFLAVRNDDTALNLQHTDEGKSFNDLRDSMQAVNQIIKNLRVKYQQKEIVCGCGHPHL